MLKTSLAFIEKDFLIESSYKTTFLIQFSTILLGVAMFYYVGEIFGSVASPHMQSYKNNYFGFLLIGLAFLDYHILSLSHFSKSIQESQMMGTLEIIILSPVKLSTMIICSSLWGYIFTSMRFFVYLIFAALFFGLNLMNANITGAFLVLVLSIICFASFGIMMAGIVVVFKKGDSLNAIASSASMFLGGVLYPVEVMPDWLRHLSQYIPLTHALNAMRQALLQGYEFKQLLPELIFLSIFAVIFFPLGLLFFRLAVRVAKKNGTLTHY